MPAKATNAKTSTAKSPAAATAKPKAAAKVASEPDDSGREREAEARHSN